MLPNENPLFVPADSQLPGPGSGIDDETGRGAEYDRYFGLVRGRPDLASWSRSCLETQRNLLDHLVDSRLPADRRCELLHGMLLVAHETMESWLSTAAGNESHEP